jgi:hypothetical protein
MIYIINNSRLIVYTCNVEIVDSGVVLTTTTEEEEEDDEEEKI